MAKFTFNKQQKVTSKKVIELLFQRNSPAVLAYPFRISFIAQPFVQEQSCQVLLAVSKKKFPKAVMRNKIKRQLRELYRINKHVLTDFLLQNNLQIAISIAYLGSNKLNITQNTSNFIACLNKLKTAIEKVN